MQPHYDRRNRNDSAATLPPRADRALATEQELRAYRKSVSLDSPTLEPSSVFNSDTATDIAGEIIVAWGYAGIGAILKTAAEDLTRSITDRTCRKSLAIAALTLAESDLFCTGNYQRGFDWIVRASALAPIDPLTLTRAWQLYTSDFLPPPSDEQNIKLNRRVVTQGLRMFDRFVQLTGKLRMGEAFPHPGAISAEALPNLIWTLTAAATFANDWALLLRNVLQEPSNAAHEAQRARFFAQSVAKLIGLESDPLKLLANPPREIRVNLDNSTLLWVPLAWKELACACETLGLPKHEAAAKEISTWFVIGE